MAIVGAKALLRLHDKFHRWLIIVICQVLLEVLDVTKQDYSAWHRAENHSQWLPVNNGIEDHCLALSFNLGSFVDEIDQHT